MKILDKNRRWGTAMRDDFHTVPNVQRKDRPCRAPRTASSLLVCIVFRPRPFAEFVELNKGWFDDVQRHYVGKLYKLMEKPLISLRTPKRVLRSTFFP